MFQTSPSISSLILITLSLGRSTARTLYFSFSHSRPYKSHYILRAIRPVVVGPYSVYPPPIPLALLPLHVLSCTHSRPTCRFFLAMRCTTSPLFPVMLPTFSKSIRNTFDNSNFERTTGRYESIYLKAYPHLIGAPNDCKTIAMTSLHLSVLCASVA